MGWNPMPGLTFIAGKQANPFYTTDHYDPEVDPSEWWNELTLTKSSLVLPFH
jgi:hypothetical protein